MGGNSIKLTKGERFGLLTVVAPSLVERGNVWRCKCDCGNLVSVKAVFLRHGNNRSCGCLVQERIRKLNAPGAKRNRLPYPHAKRLISIYGGMKSRCYSTAHEHGDCYGGRGIRICDEWLQDRRKFYQWAVDNGHHPDLTLDRIDVNGNYEPDNCRFVTRIVNANNRRNNKYIEWNGESRTAPEWARQLGMSLATLSDRLRSGWDVEKAFTQPVRKKSQ